MFLCHGPLPWNITFLYASYVPVLILCLGKTNDRNIILRAKELGMSADQYVFFTFNMLPDHFTYTPWIDPDKPNEADTKERMQAFLLLKQVRNKQSINQSV